MAYSFRKILFIGQNLKHVHMTYSFLELLIFFWLTLDTISVWSLFLSSQKKYFMWVQTLWETNYKIKTIIFKNLFFDVKLKFLMNKSEFFSVSWTYFQRSSRSQMFFKIRALKHFAILRIKKRLQHRCFPVRSIHVMLTYW